MLEISTIKERPRALQWEINVVLFKQNSGDPRAHEIFPQGFREILCMYGEEGPEFLQGVLERPSCKVVRMKLKFHWRLQDVDVARTMRHLPRETQV